MSYVEIQRQAEKRIHDFIEKEFAFLLLQVTTDFGYARRRMISDQYPGSPGSPWFATGQKFVDCVTGYEIRIYGGGGGGPITSRGGQGGLDSVYISALSNPHTFVVGSSGSGPIGVGGSSGNQPHNHIYVDLSGRVHSGWSGGGYPPVVFDQVASSHPSSQSGCSETSSGSVGSGSSLDSDSDCGSVFD